MAHTGYYSDVSSFDNVDQALAQAELYRNQALAAAVAAQESEDIAESSAVTATADATSALLSKNAAEASAITSNTNADASSVSATNASTSATTATTQADSASASATTATTQAANAAASATTATTQAGIAITQATNASASASTATTQATNASNSATSASTSASTATTAATTATTQAGNASTSATAASGSASSASTSAATATTQAANAAASAASVTGAAVPMFQVSWWCGNRASIPAGYLPGDGQTALRATYPDAWTAINAGNMPLASSDAVWLSTPTERGKFSRGDGSTTFRLPDLNGKSSGTLGAPFLRGDGTLSAAVAGVIQLDAYQNHSVTFLAGAISGTVASPFTSMAVGSTAPNNTNLSTQLGVSSFAAVSGFGTPRTDVETRPLNVTGCFIIKIYGAVTNAGTIDASTLNTRVTALEAIGKPFTKEFISAELTITSGGFLSTAHGLGVAPKLWDTLLICKTAEVGYAVGDIVKITHTQDATASYGVSTVCDATNFTSRFGASGFFVLTKNSGAFTAITNANWRFLLRAWA